MCDAHEPPPASVEEQAWSAWKARVLAAPAASPEGHTRRVIVDCDPGVDDAEALMMVLAAPNVDVIALTVASGNAPLKDVARNACRLLEACGRPDIPVYAGAARPLLEAPHHALYYHGSDGFGGFYKYAADPPKKCVPGVHAANALIDLCRAHATPLPAAPHIAEQRAQLMTQLEQTRDACSAAVTAHALEKVAALSGHLADLAAQLASLEGVDDFSPGVEILALGPLTNLALACRLDPSFPHMVKGLVVMGGTLRGCGNVKHKPTNEFNINADPDSAEITLRAFPQAVIVTWETCIDHKFPWAELDGMLEGHNGPKPTFWRNIRAHSRGFSSFPYVPCDPLAAAVLLDPHAVQEVKLRHMRVELQGSITRGQTVIDWGYLNDGQPNCFVVTKFNLDVFKALFKHGLLSS